MKRHWFAAVTAGMLLLVSCSQGSESTTTTAVPVLPSTSTSTTTVPASTTTTTGAGTTTTTTTVPIDDLAVVLAQAASGFDNPVLLIADPRGSDDYVVEQPGRVMRLSGTQALDIREDVGFGGENGLLGLAFHPDFATNQLAYLNYITNDGNTRIEEFSVSDDGSFGPDRRVILDIVQPAGNHNGGMIAFGPDGYLWIGMGDGGGANDFYKNGQNPETLHGSMLRIAVGPDINAPYAIPADNPFVSGGGAQEAWAIGLRNPWRFSFDGDDLWIADVGQRDYEEVNVVSAREKGLNFGWPILEGSTCFQATDCDRAGLVEPIADYSHGSGCSVTGGYVYRGEAVPELKGHYFYSDFCTGFLRSISPDFDEFDWTGQVGSVAAVSGFGVGTDGELYLISHHGTIYRLERAS